MKLSIIVPVYNVEEYLSECLDSLIEQDIDEYEIICVNDGSTDKSKDILNNYTKKSSLIKIINQENQGLSGARNTGMQHAAGDYILFVDSDDKLKSNSLNTLLLNVTKHNLDLLDFNIVAFDGSKQVPWRRVNFDYRLVKTGKQYFKDFVTKKKAQPNVSAWSHIYNCKIIKEHNLKFPFGKYYEDIPFTYQFYMLAKRVMAINEDIYYYRKNPGSITKSKPKLKHLEDLIYIWSLLNKLVSKYKIKVPMDNFLVPIIKRSYNLSKLLGYSEIRHVFDKNFFIQNETLLINNRNKIIFTILKSRVGFFFFKFMLQIKSKK